MRDHLVSGMSWVTFPCEASYRWWLVVTPSGSKFMFQDATGRDFTVPLDDEVATGMLDVIGTVTNNAPNADSGLL